MPLNQAATPWSSCTQAEMRRDLMHARANQMKNKNMQKGGEDDIRISKGQIYSTTPTQLRLDNGHGL